MFIAKALVIILCNRIFFLINKMLYHSKDMFNFYPGHTINCVKTDGHLSNVTLRNAADSPSQRI